MMYRCIVYICIYIYISVGCILPFCLRMGDWHGMFLERNRALAANVWCRVHLPTSLEPGDLLGE